MNFTRTAISGVLIVEPKVFGDARGYFSETFNQRLFDEAVGHPVGFVQDNQSRSSKGVLRGLHCQLPPHEQGKLVRVISGRILDVAADLRHDSPTCGRWIAEELTDENRKQLWIPPGMLHGFLVLTDVAEVQYKVTDYYAPTADRSVRWDDPTLGIAWPDIGVAPVISSKDERGLSARALLEEILKLRQSVTTSAAPHDRGSVS